jgi:hypothetical protein
MFLSEHFCGKSSEDVAPGSPGEDFHGSTPGRFELELKAPR